MIMRVTQTVTVDIWLDTYLVYDIATEDILALGGEDGKYGNPVECFDVAEKLFIIIVPTSAMLNTNWCSNEF